MDDAEMWYCVPNTVIDVEAGKPKRKNIATGGTLTDLVIRSDADRLRKIAALARAWYGQARAAVTAALVGVEPGYGVGTFLTIVQDAWRFEEVNSVVTEKTYTFGAVQTTTIKTSYGEIDVTMADGRRRLPLGR